MEFATIIQVLITCYLILKKGWLQVSNFRLLQIDTSNPEFVQLSLDEEKHQNIYVLSKENLINAFDKYTSLQYRICKHNASYLA